MGSCLLVAALFWNSKLFSAVNTPTKSSRRGFSYFPAILFDTNCRGKYSGSLVTISLARVNTERIKVTILFSKEIFFFITSVYIGWKSTGRINFISRWLSKGLQTEASNCRQQSWCWFLVFCKHKIFSEQLKLYWITNKRERVKIWVVARLGYPGIDEQGFGIYFLLRLMADFSG